MLYLSLQSVHSSMFDKITSVAMCNYACIFNLTITSMANINIELSVCAKYGFHTLLAIVD